ncbi:MAG: hypothetical protein LUH43_05100 [Clostridia bacterium]|nr:hypothetical protein [Clostridia bacterium]
MCDVCGCDVGHIRGCPMERRGRYEIECAVCGGEICMDEICIYVPESSRHEHGFICERCIEEFTTADILEVCGMSSVSEIISELSGKVMRLGEKR